MNSLKRACYKFSSREIGKDTLGSFEDVIMKINSSETVKYTQTFLNELGHKKFSLKGTKKLLSAYMVFSNPSDIFSVIQDPEEELIGAAEELIDILQELVHRVKNDVNHLGKMNEFYGKYEAFAKKFDEWKKKDVKMMKQVLSQAHLELKETKDLIVNSRIEEGREITPDEQIWTEEIEKQQQQLETAFKIVAGNNDIDQIESYAPDTSEFREQIMEIAQTAYWESFREEIDSKNFSRVIKLLDEIRERLAKLTPNRPDLIQELAETLDTSYLAQLIDKEVLDGEQFMALVLFILDRIQSLEAPVENESTNELRETVLEKINAEETYSQILPFIFREMIRKIERIEKDLQAFYDSIKID